MTDQNQKPAPDAASTDQATKNLHQAEAGDKTAASRLRETGKSNPPAAEAAEQEASDGPPGRGLAR